MYCDTTGCNNSKIPSKTVKNAFFILYIINLHKIVIDILFNSFRGREYTLEFGYSLIHAISSNNYHLFSINSDTEVFFEIHTLKKSWKVSKCWKYWELIKNKRGYYCVIMCKNILEKTDLSWHIINYNKNAVSSDTILITTKLWCIVKTSQICELQQKCYKLL